MTIRFINAWNGYSDGDKADLDNEQELIDAGLAIPYFEQYGPVGERVLTQPVDPRTGSMLHSYDVILSGGGQSNGDGATDLPAKEDGKSAYVLLLNKENDFELCSEPAGRTGPKWVNNIPDGNPVTPGLRFSSFTSCGKAIANLTGMCPLMVPNAIGSTGMQNWEPPETEDDYTTLFGAMTARTKLALSHRKYSGLGTSPIFLWFGHEANSGEITEDLATGAIGLEYINRWKAHMENIRARFPNAPMIFAQLATHFTGSLASNLRRAAESQRLSEATYGSSTLLVDWEDTTKDFSSSNWEASEEDANNNITVLSNYSFSMVGNGDTILENKINLTSIGQRYKLTLDVTGTGLWKFLASNTQVGSTRSAGSGIEIDFVTDGSGNLRFVRGAAAQSTDLVFTLISLEELVPPLIENTYMIVTHDLPRNINDGYHINEEGQREVGLRYAKCYAQRVLGMHWVNGTGPRLDSVTSPTATTVKVKFNKTIQADTNNYGVDLANSLFRVYDGGVEATLTTVERDSVDDTAVLITVSAPLAGTVVVTYGDRSGPNDGTWRAGVVKDLDNMPAPQFGPVVAV